MFLLQASSGLKTLFNVLPCHQRQHPRPLMWSALRAVKTCDFIGFPLTSKTFQCHTMVNINAIYSHYVGKKALRENTNLSAESVAENARGNVSI